MSKKFKINWDAVQEKIEKSEESNSSFSDERFYTPDWKDGKFEGIIRFLPNKDLEELPYFKYYRHNISNNGRFLNVICPTSFGLDCPICKKNGEDWAHDEDAVRKRSRKQNFVSNIIVIKDNKNPDNEGKVFLYRYGKTIFQKIESVRKPEEDSIDDPIEIFDFYSGANFKLKIKLKKVGNSTMPNYDNCSFTESVPLYNGDDDKIDQVYEDMYNLQEYSDSLKSEMQSYEEIEKKFNDILGFKKSSGEKFQEEEPVRRKKSKLPTEESEESEEIDEKDDVDVDTNEKGSTDFDSDDFDLDDEDLDSLLDD